MGKIAMGVTNAGMQRNAASHREKLKELFFELEDALLLARMLPGQTLTLQEFAALGRASLPDMKAVLPDLVATGLIVADGAQVTAKALDPNAMFATLPRRMVLEIAIVRGAAAKADDAQIKAMQASEALQRRCAMVGDMDGLMTAERKLERLLVEAAGLEAAGTELISIKREFRRAWCAINRLKNFTHVATIRTALVAAIAARDPEAAEAQVRVFFDHLMRTY
jgi:DNA-binding GntR family transcriptional regulator